MRTLQHLVRACSLAVAGLALGVGPAWSADVWLEARPLVGTEYPAGIPATVPMWGYASCGNAFSNCAAASVPGPQLVVPVGDTTGLTIHLRNSLPTGLTVPDMTSIVIPGQRDNGMVPVMFPPENSPHGAGEPDRVRMRSFTHETPQGQARDYVWSNLEPGTYLYHSGTQAQVQVQMGLYGSVKADAAAGQAYAGQAYASEVTLLFSEIDPALHVAVAGGGTLESVVVPPYGTPPMTSTINYQPKYFLMNGAPYSASTLPICAGKVGERVLLRLLNAGLESHVATLLGGQFQMIAEDGNALAYGRDQYETLLPAGKTMDAIWVPEASGIYSIYDRRNREGMLAKLEIEGPPVITSTPPLTGQVGVPYTYDMNAIDCNLPIDYEMHDANPAGLRINLTTGLVQWTPTAAQAGNQVIQLQAMDATGLITEQNFTVVVNDGPPRITTTPLLIADVGLLYTYDMNVTDLDLPIAYALRGANPAGLTIDVTTGLVSWTPTAAQLGNQIAQLQATDAMGLVTEQNFTIVVHDGPPVITTTPLLIADVGVLYTYAMHATDLDLPIYYEPWGTTNPAGLTIGFTTGLVQWTPTAAQVGNQVIQLQATDATDLVTEQNFTVVVNNVPPVITSTTATAVFRNLAGSANDRWTISGTAVSSTSPCPATPSASCDLSIYRMRGGAQSLIGTTTVVQANGTWSFVEIPATPGRQAGDTVRVRLTQTNAILIDNVPITIQTTVLP